MGSTSDLHAGVVYAPRSKTEARQEIPFNAKVRSVLKEAQKLRSVQSDRVFLNREGQPITTDSANSALVRAYKRAKIKVAPWKVLRRTFGSRLAMAGVSADGNLVAANAQPPPPAQQAGSLNLCRGRGSLG